MDALAETGNPDRYPLPYPSVEGSRYDFSFSGLKTAVVNLLHNAAQKGETLSPADLSAALRRRVCDLLTDHTMAAVEEFPTDTLAVAGGVSANRELRRRMEAACRERGIRLCLPELRYCGDNAAMVGVQAGYEFAAGHLAGPELNAFATLDITSL